VNKYPRLLALFVTGILMLAVMLTTTPILTPTAAQDQAAPSGQTDERPGTAAQEMHSSMDTPAGFAPAPRTNRQVMAAEAVERLKKVEPRAGRLRLRPTMDEGLYDSLKNIANATVPASKSIEPGKGGTAGAPAPAPQAPALIKGVNFNGPSEAGWNPPDTHGAVGPSHYVAVTNSSILRYNKSGGLLSNVTLAAFFNYTLKGVFDPRVVYDKASARWIILAEAFEESATVQRLLIAVSQTSNAMGGYWVYKFDVNVLNNNDFFDYPQLGVDKNHIIITANIYGPAPTRAYREGRVYAFPKLTMYAGGTASFFYYRAAFLNSGTIAPPIVLDANANAFLLSAPAGGGTTLRLYRLTDGSPSATLTFVGTVTAPSFSIPPDAVQVNSCNTQKLDTDVRFQSASTQIGTSLFNAHTSGLSGFPAPRYYEINTSTRTLIRTASFFKSSTSHDFNVSIAANAARDMVVTWTATDPASNVNPQVRFAGRRAADPNGLGAGVALFTSTTCHREGTSPVLRWGDYSAVSVDPTNSLLFWVINQKMNSQTVWGSRIGRVGF
jgi:hypothetical protein